MNKILIIAGLTATGKTQFAQEVAKRFNGELISADSRQVYKGMDIITGKDKDKIDVPVWLYDLVNPNEPFSVSLWHNHALSAIKDISSRGKLPIVVGGTGLYLRSLIQDLETINISPNPTLRQKLSQLSASDLFAKLQKLDPIKVNSLNNSEKNNPRRLIRYLEIVLSKQKQRPSLKLREGLGVSYCVLTCPNPILKERIKERVVKRLHEGALTELKNLLKKYNKSLPSFTACGYQSLLASTDPQVWINSEYHYAKRQKTFFQKYFPQNSVDITQSGWQSQLLDIISLWVTPLVKP